MFITLGPCSGCWGCADVGFSTAMESLMGVLLAVILNFSTAVDVSCKFNQEV